MLPSQVCCKGEAGGNVGRRDGQEVQAPREKSDVAWGAAERQTLACSLINPALPSPIVPALTFNSRGYCDTPLLSSGLLRTGQARLAAALEYATMLLTGTLMPSDVVAGALVCVSLCFLSTISGSIGLKQQSSTHCYSTRSRAYLSCDHKAGWVGGVGGVGGGWWVGGKGWAADGARGVRNCRDAAACTWRPAPTRSATSAACLYPCPCCP